MAIFAVHFLVLILCGSSSFGRARPCQGRGGRFEPGLPLKLADSICYLLFFSKCVTRVVELVDTQDLKSCSQQCECGFNSHPGYKPQQHVGALLFMYFVYILYSKNYDRYYVGHCENMAIRLTRHNNKGVPSTKSYIPWELVYTENFTSRSSAVARESEIKKKKSRKYIEFLVNQYKTTG